MSIPAFAPEMQEYYFIDENIRSQQETKYKFHVEITSKKV